MKPLSTLVAAVALLAVAGAARADQGTLLRYKFDKDKPQIYRQHTTLNQSQKVADQKYKITFDHSEVSTRQFKEVDKKGNLHVDTTVKQVKLNVDMGPLGKYEYDSKKSDNDDSSQIAGALKPVYDLLNGSTLTLVVSPRGKVEELKGYKELFADALKDNPLGAQFAGGGTEEAARMQWGEYYPMLPEKPVRPGDTWSAPFKLDLPKLGKATGKRNYTYDGPGKVGDRKTLEISVTLELSFDLDTKAEGAQVTGNIAVNNSSGKIHFDPKAGRIVRMENKYTLAGNLNAKVGDNDIGIEIEQVQSVKMELLDKLPK